MGAVGSHDAHAVNDPNRGNQGVQHQHQPDIQHQSARVSNANTSGPPPPASVIPGQHQNNTGCGTGTSGPPPPVTAFSGPVYTNLPKPANPFGAQGASVQAPPGFQPPLPTLHIPNLPTHQRPPHVRQPAGIPPQPLSHKIVYQSGPVCEGGWYVNGQLISAEISAPVIEYRVPVNNQFNVLQNPMDCS